MMRRLFRTREMKKRTVFSFAFLFAALMSNGQMFEDPVYLGELYYWNKLPIDSIWEFTSGTDKGIDSIARQNTGWIRINTENMRDESGRYEAPDGWFRKSFQVPDSLFGKTIIARMGHFGASEIYLDGKLIGRYGVVASTTRDETIWVPRKPFFIQLDSAASHIVIIHYSNHHMGDFAGSDYKFAGSPSLFIGFRFLLSPKEIAFGYTYLPVVPMILDILITFSIFFIFVYFFYPKRLASLLTALTLIDFCILFISTQIILTSHEWGTLIIANRVGRITSAWLTCLQVIIIYALYYNNKMPRRTWLVLGLMISFVGLVLFSAPPSIYVKLLLLPLFELFRMLVIGIRDKKSGFWILMIGLLLQEIGFFVFVADIFNLFPHQTFVRDIFVVLFPQMGIPVTFALHLAWEFGTANKDLRLQLQQVNQLSEKSIAQEQEKQQILALQNTNLENQVTERTASLNKSLQELKATQSQLIQSEKMASLGELTAGIAHEIQNPLNFVNNFSEVNLELMDEMKQEMQSGHADKALELGENIQNNLEKVVQHGKRADSIVKGMLQHSRTRTEQKESIDIRALADEYLRLSYHGMRAKDKLFNVDYHTDFPETLSNLNIIPQDIGRVMLNLYNNAFYSVMKKKEHSGDTYRPMVWVTIKKIQNFLEIQVRDNGTGIPFKLVDKIFQPFFTTKPTGQGTGLGLSLSYDIITKEHNGTLKVETKEGEYATFIIQLPLEPKS